METKVDFTKTIRTGYYTNFVFLLIAIIYILKKKTGLLRSIGILILAGIGSTATAYVLSPPIMVEIDENAKLDTQKLKGISHITTKENVSLPNGTYKVLMSGYEIKFYYNNKWITVFHTNIGIRGTSKALLIVENGKGYVKV